MRGMSVVHAALHLLEGSAACASVEGDNFLEACRISGELRSMYLDQTGDAYP